MFYYFYMAAIRGVFLEGLKRLEAKTDIAKDSELSKETSQELLERVCKQKMGEPRFKAFCEKHDLADTWDQVSMQELTSLTDGVVSNLEREVWVERAARAKFRKKKYKEFIKFCRWTPGTLNDLEGLGLKVKAYLALSWPDDALTACANWQEKIPPETLYEWAIFAEEKKQSDFAVKMYKKILAANGEFRDVAVRYKSLTGREWQVRNIKKGTSHNDKVSRELGHNGTSKQKDLSSLREAALQANKDGDFDRAIGICNKVLKSDKEDAKTLTIRGVSYLAVGEYESAKSDFDTAIRVDAESANAFEGLAFLAQKRGELDIAMANINKAIRINPDDGEYYWLRAQVFFQKDNTDKAMNDFDLALQSDLNKELKGQIHCLRGIAFSNQHNYKKATADFDASINIDPNSAETYVYRGMAYANLGEVAKAKCDLDKALELSPGSADALGCRASIYVGLGEIDKAKSDLDKAISLKPENIEELKKSRAELDR